MGSIKVLPPSGSGVDVNITRVNGSKAVVAYTDGTYSTSISLPENIRSAKTYFLPDDDTYIASMSISGIDAGSRVVPLFGSQSVALAADVDLSVEQIAERVSDSESLLSAATLAGVRLPDITQFRCVDIPTTLTVPTYDGSNVTVHPSALYFPDGWNGYRYWLAITPYPGSDSEYENPSILASNDGVTFAAPPGVTNPLVASPAGIGYNSDPCLTLGPDNRLYLFFRDYNATGSTPPRDRLLVMSSADGISWSTPVVIVDTADNVQRLASPTAWYDRARGLWIILAVDIVGTQTIKRLTSSSATSGWSAASAISFTPALSGTNPWHIEARPVGADVVMLCQDGTPAGGSLYLMSSQDGGVTFTRSTVRMGVSNAYRSSFVPVITPDGVALDIFQGALAGTVRRSIATTRYPRDLAQAALGVAPFLVGDTFNRADSAVSAGSASSGQAYTVWAGTPGVASRSGYAASNNNTKAVITAAADGIFSAEASVVGAQFWLVFRGSDTNNHWRFGATTGGGVELQKIVAGSVTILISTGAGVLNDGDRISVRCEGNAIRAFVNGWEVGSVSDSFNASATNVGWQLTTNVARIKNLTARSL